MKRFRHPLLLGVIVPAFALLAGCSRKEAPPGGGTTASSAPARSSSASDYSKPALTEEKIARFIDSMKEDKNPLEFIFKQGGGMRSMAEMKAKEVELTAFAQKYGFKDYTEYIDTWGRIMVGQMQLAAVQMTAGVQDMMKKQMAQAEEKLKDSNLSAEDRKMYTGQLADAKKSLDDLNKPTPGGLNAADLELVRKHDTEITAAGKKYKTQ